MNPTDVFFVDIDGVLADCTHRLHFARENNYDEFYSDENMSKDGLITEGGYFLYNLLDMYDNNELDTPHFLIVFVTGRPEKTRKITEKWLSKNISFLNEQVTDMPMLMRKDGDYRPSPEIKRELIKQCMSELDKVYSDYELENATYTIIDDDVKNVDTMYDAVVGYLSEHSMIHAKVLPLTFGTRQFSGS